MRAALRAAGQERGKKERTAIGSHTLATLLAGIAFERQCGKDSQRGKQGERLTEWLIGDETAPHHRRFAAELPPKGKP